MNVNYIIHILHICICTFKLFVCEHMYVFLVLYKESYMCRHMAISLNTIRLPSAPCVDLLQMPHSSESDFCFKVSNPTLGACEMHACTLTSTEICMHALLCVCVAIYQPMCLSLRTRYT